MTKKEAAHIVDVAFGIPQAVRRAGEDRTYHEEEIREAKEMAFKALEQEPCGGCISRQAAIDLADELKDDLPDDDRLSDMVMSHNEGILEYQTKLSLLPPVTPAEKVGRWIAHFDESGKWYECDQCRTDWGGSVNYCPNCGAKM